MYITVKCPPAYKQLTLEDILFGRDLTMDSLLLNSNESNTKTFKRDDISPAMRRKFGFDFVALVSTLKNFNAQTEPLRKVDRHSLYDSFKIPKRSGGGYRKINAPKPALSKALDSLKRILEEDFRALYHTSAFAYMKKRSTVKLVRKHQLNQSKWFCGLDLHDFFGSTTLDFVMNQFKQVYPFSHIVKYTGGEDELRKALELAFLDGGLPQGTPVSPIITNIMMLPIDFELTKKFREYNNGVGEQHIIYTRYADDFKLSSRFKFDPKIVQGVIKDTLKSFNAPFELNESKTTFGSNAGRNWMFGIMLNKDNQMTIGHKKKKEYESLIYNYIKDKKRGVNWLLEDVQTLQGQRAYYRMIEGETIDRIEGFYNSKYSFNFEEALKEDLRR